jgi:hypothetical protein
MVAREEPFATVVRLAAADVEDSVEYEMANPVLNGC